MTIRVAGVLRFTGATRERIWIVLRDVALLGLHAHRESRIAFRSCAAVVAI